jgi:hypothetical protein
MGDVRLQDSIVVRRELDSITVGTPPLLHDSQESMGEKEMEGGKAPSADSSFSEATDENRSLDEGLETDSLDDEDEIMLLKDSDWE